MYALNRTIGDNMDEKEFEKFLERSGLAPNTIRLYVTSVKKFEKWLFEHQGKRLEDANESDIKNWKSYLQKEKRFATYFYGLKKYYLYQRNDDMVKTIKEILSKLRPPKSTLQRLIRWTDFRKVMSKAERIRISDRDRALLNLLWSEMNSKEILDLRACDIDFEKRLITSRISGKTHHVTQEAWDALEKYIPIQDRDNGKLLFSINRRRLQQITEQYFKSVKQTPKSLMSSCRDDLISAGKTIRFATESEKKPRVKEGQIEKSSIKKNLFDKLVQEIKRFGARIEIQERIKKIKGEEEFQTLLEGYLLATFPEQRIICEFPFKGWKTGDSKIDFVVGKDQRVPIEVKLAQKEIGDHLRKGIGQVNEFLKYSGTRKGILVIRDQERDPERQKHSGMQDSVYIIVI